MSSDSIGLYIDLDTLLDTRMATLFKMDPTKVEGVLPMYFERISDEFPGYDTEAFKAMYAARDNETLKHAMMTEAVDILNYFAAKTLNARVGTPFRKQPKVTLNTFPYVLPKETIEVMIRALIKHTDDRTDIEVVNMPMDEVSPLFIKRDYAMVAMYDYCAWLDYHTDNGNFSRTQLPEILFHVPAILKSVEAAASLPSVNIFSRISQFFSGMVKLQFLPISKFCVNHVQYLEYLKKTHKT